MAAFSIAGCNAILGVGDPTDTTPGADAGVGAVDSSAEVGQGCSGSDCAVAACPVGTKTTVRGRVYDPAGQNALYNVLVYVPSGPLAPLTAGASCDPCGGTITPPPLVMTRTDAKGDFVLEDVPLGFSVPIVVQTGKWRRQVHASIQLPCADNALVDGSFHLPRNGSEGDMPEFAVVTGGCDALECLLQGMGVDQSEFVPGASPAGHVHVFNGAGGEFPAAPSAGGTASDPFGGELWNSLPKMLPYDAVLLSCECSASNENKGGDIGASGARQAMHDYADLGGRVLATHYHSTWLQNSPSTDWQGSGHGR